jgi:hypothetical protein
MIFCLRWIQSPDRSHGSNSKNMLNFATPGSPGAVVYQNYYKGCYTKNGHACNNAIKYKPLSKMMLFDSRWVQTSKGGIM